jgi:hypothetical protein
MKEITVKLDDEIVMKLEKLQKHYGFLSIEETIRFVLGSYLYLYDVFDDAFEQFAFIINEIIKELLSMMQRYRKDLDYR